MKTMILGDPHIGKGLKLGKPDPIDQINTRLKDQIKLLNWVNSYSKENNIERLIITGDVYDDPKPHPTIIMYFMDFLHRASLQFREIDIIVGNHDIIRSGSLTNSALDIVNPSLYKNTVRVHKEITIVNNITYVPYTDRRLLNCDNILQATQLLRSLIKKNVPNVDGQKLLVGHLAIHGSMYIGDELEDLNCEIMCPIDMFSDFDVVWMGHVHRPQILSKKPLVGHTGSMDISDFGETDHTKQVVVFDSDNPIDYELVDIPTRKLVRFKLEIPENSENTTEFIKKQIKKISKENLDDSIVKVQISLPNKEVLSSDRDEIKKILYDNGVFHVSDYSERRNVSVVPQDKISKINSDMTPLTALQTYANSFDWPESESKEFMEIASNVISRYYHK